MIELHLIGYTADLRHLVLDLDVEGAVGRYRLVIDPDLFATVDDVRRQRREQGLPVGDVVEYAEELGIDVEALGRAVAERIPEEPEPETEPEPEPEPEPELEPETEPEPEPEPEPETEVEAEDSGLPPSLEELLWGPPSEDDDEDDDEPEALDEEPAEVDTAVRILAADEAVLRLAESEADSPREPVPEPEPEPESEPEPVAEPAPEPEPEPAPDLRPPPEPTPRHEPKRRDPKLSPAEIQSRLRQGRSPRAVAKEAGTDLAWIERWATPIEAERTRILEQARSLKLERPRLGPSQDPLGGAVRRNLTSRNADPTEADWEVARRKNGTWKISVKYTQSGRRRTATWTYEPGDDELRAASQEARELGYTRRTPRKKKSKSAAKKSSS